MQLYLKLWFGEFLALANNYQKALVNIVFGELVMKTGEVFLQFADSSLIVRQHGQTEGQITPLTLSPTQINTNDKKQNKEKKRQIK